MRQAQTILGAIAVFIDLAIAATSVANAQANTGCHPAASLNHKVQRTFVARVVDLDPSDQTLLLRYRGTVATVPFSRWTDFHASGSISHFERGRSIEPTDVRAGDRIEVWLDPSEATARTVVVFTRRDSSELDLPMWHGMRKDAPGKSRIS